MIPSNKKQPPVTMDDLIVRLSSVLTTTEELVISDISAVSRYGGGDISEMENVLIITFRRPTEPHMVAWDKFSTALVTLYYKKKSSAGSGLKWGVDVFEHKIIHPTVPGNAVVAAEIHLSWKTPTKSTFTEKATKQESAQVLYVRENLRNLDLAITDFTRVLDTYKKLKKKKDEEGVDVDVKVNMGSMGDNVYSELSKKFVSSSSSDARPSVPKGTMPRSGVVNLDEVTVLQPGGRN